MLGLEIPCHCNKTSTLLTTPDTSQFQMKKLPYLNSFGIPNKTFLKNRNYFVYWSINSGKIIMTGLLRNFLVVFLLKFRLKGRFLDKRNFRIIIKFMTLLSSSGEVFPQGHAPDFEKLCFFNKCEFSKLLHLIVEDIRINWSLIKQFSLYLQKWRIL